MTAAEFRCYREQLGLPTQWLADLLGVRERTIGRWEFGQQPVPQGVADDMWRLVDEADDAVAELRKTISDGKVDTLITYRTDRDYAEIGGKMPASWHRSIAARAADGGDTTIVYNKEVDKASALD